MRKLTLLFLCAATVSAVGVSVSHAQETVPAGAGASGRAVLRDFQETCQQLQTFQAEGEVISLLDMSGVSAENVPHLGEEARRKLREDPDFQSALKTPKKMRHTFTMALDRSGKYRVDWQQHMGNGTVVTGAIWSDGKTHYLKLPGRESPIRQDNRMIALAMATGVSGGAAGTLPPVFYDTRNNPFVAVGNAQSVGSGEIEGEVCDCVTATLGHQKMTYWISRKRKVLLKQKHELSGDVAPPPIDDEQVKRALTAMNREPTPEAVARMKRRMAVARLMTRAMTGSLMQRYYNVRINEPLPSGLFDAPEETAEAETP